MALADDLTAEVRDIFRTQWTVRDGYVVPAPASIGLANDAVRLDATVLYSDLSDSTSLVDAFKPTFAAEIYKAYLGCAAKLIRSEGGEITAYDGDRIMAVFLGDARNTAAARTALKINYARVRIINPAIKAQYPNSAFRLKSVTAVDTSKVWVVRTGVRGANDLGWIGKSANHAAKLAALGSDYPSRVSEEVFKTMNKSVKTSADGRDMWELATWNAMGRTIYRSTWMQEF